MAEDIDMAKFLPETFDYEIQGDSDEALHYQKFKIMEPPMFLDVIELAYHKKIETWIIFVRSENMKQFVRDIEFPQGEIYSLFIGTILSDFDFRFIITKICKDPNAIVQMGC